MATIVRRIECSSTHFTSALGVHKDDPCNFTCQYVNRARGQGGWKDTAFGSMKSYVNKVLETEQVRAETFVELQDGVTHLPNHTECGID